MLDTKVDTKDEILGLFEHQFLILLKKFVLPIVFLMLLSVDETQSKNYQIAHLILLASLTIETNIHNFNYTIPNTSFHFKIAVLILYIFCNLVNVASSMMMITYGTQTNLFYVNIVLAVVILYGIMLSLVYFPVTLCYCLYGRNSREKNGNEDLPHIRVIKMLFGIRRYNKRYEDEV